MVRRVRKLAARVFALLALLSAAVAVAASAVPASARHVHFVAFGQLDRDVRSHRPDIVILQFGINDAWIDELVGHVV